MSPVGRRGGRESSRRRQFDVYGWEGSPLCGGVQWYAGAEDEDGDIGGAQRGAEESGDQRR